MCKARARVAALALLLVVAMVPASAEAGQLRGRVYKTGGPGIASLVVKLSPAQGTSGPQRATLTRQDGQFDLGNVESGDYVLQVLQADKPVYQTPISVPAAGVNKEIELK
jgi:hypothetical protein